MARIAGVDLPPQKRLWVGLTSIYGIGQERAKKLAAKAGVDHTKKIRDLTEDEVNHLRQEIEKEGRVEGDLRKEIQMNIRRLIEIQAYRGIRHRRNLPVRGLRTHNGKIVQHQLSHYYAKHPNQAIVEAFRANKIEIPFPQREVRLLNPT